MMMKLLFTLNIVWNIDPRIIPPFEQIRWYGMFWAIGFLVAYQITRKIFSVEKRNVEDLDRLAMYSIIGVVIGARLGHVLFYEPLYYLSHPIEILPIRLEPSFAFIGFKGLASHGGVVGACIALFLFARKYNYGFMWLLDRLVIGGAALGGCIRLGNLMNSEIIGLKTTVPWAFIFTQIDPYPRHPSQLYEALSYFVISLILFQVWKKRRHHNQPGYLLGVGLILIFLARILIEFTKENQVDFESHLILNMGQILSIPLVLLGVFLVFRRKNRPVVVK